MSDFTVIETLAEIYPQLYLDPNREEKEAYRKVVLQGEMPESRDLSLDRKEIVETPAGTVVVVSLRNRADYEVFVRCMMAAKEGPKAPIPASQGASTLVAFNWPRIYAHREQFMEEQRAAGVEEPDWSEEFSRFISVPANYQDLFVVLSWGPYSSVTAAEAGQTEDTWPEIWWRMPSAFMRPWVTMTQNWKNAAWASRESGIPAVGWKTTLTTRKNWQNP